MSMIREREREMESGKKKENKRVKENRETHTDDR